MPDLFSKSQLKERGWADSKIKNLLDPPDETRPNPHRNGPTRPIQLYRRRRVERAEASPDFRHECR
ncbi:MAG: hypothetical protein ABGZ53_29755 [Fuerstiella sp.]|nr:hypothetical protein [Planctomycetaceae bacterium]